MGNSRVLQKATKELTKAKAPSKSRDIIYDPKGQWEHPGQPTRIPGGDITMQGVPYRVYAQPNVGQPQMMYPGQDYVFPGADYVDEYPQMKRGGYTRGLVPMPKPSKKGLASKAYSRSLDATNRLFTENYLFKKPKDRKRKVFDPNAKYYEDGGEYGMPLGAGVSQNFIGNRDEFNVGGIPNLPLRDNRVNYNAFVNGFDPMTKKQYGGYPDYIETELTDDEIQAYKDGGYIVEDISIPSLNQYQDGGTYTYAGRKDSKYKKDNQGNWLISNKSTGNKFVPIKDPTGARSKELNKGAVREEDIDIKTVAPSESTDTQFLKQQIKQIGENKMMNFVNAVANQDALVEDEIKSLKSKDFLTPDERRKGLTKKSKVSKERREKAVNDLKWKYTINPSKTYEAVANQREKEGRLDSVKGLKKGSIKSKSASVYDILTNPLDAFKYSVSTGDISNMPANYNKLVQAGIDPLAHRGSNLVGNVINAYNPVDIGDKVGYYTKKGDFVMAGLNALRALPYAGPIGKIPGVAKTLSAAETYLVNPIEKGLKYAPFANMTRNSSPLVSTIGKNITGSNVLKARATAIAANNTPELADAVGEAIKKKDVKSLKKATELGADVGFNFFSGAPAATEYFLSKAAFNVMKPKQEELIHAKDPLLGGSAFDYLSIFRNLPAIRAKGGETKYVDTELTDAEIQDLVDDGYIVELL